MISIGRLGAGGGSADYYLDRQADCELDYYTGAAEATGRWLGGGADALGLNGRLDEAGKQALRGLLAGCGPDGAALVSPVLRADPRGLLLAEPLVRALAAVDAPRRGGADLLGDGKAAAVFDVASAAVEDGKPATLPADLVGQVATAAGLDPVALYRLDGADTYSSAVKHVGAKVDVRRAGLDVTVSAPKSVSVLYALADPQVAGTVRSAHDVAVGEVVAYLQRHGATAARGHQGGGQRAPRIGTDGLLVAAFDHRASRAGDPQLHTHLVVPNLVRGTDGRWSAMDTAGIYRHARTASSLYHAVLRGELTRTLGVSWTPVLRGVAEIDGIPRRLLETFSKRRRQIVEALSRRGENPATTKAAQAACLATRPAKVAELPVDMRTRWHHEAADIGIDPDFLHSVVGVAHLPQEPAVEVLAARLFGPDGVTADRTTFTRQDLARALCETLPAGTPVRLADVDRLVAALITQPDVIPIVTGPEESRERRYTTRELLTTEQNGLRLATEPRAQPVAQVRLIGLDVVLADTGLTHEQHAMVTTLVTSGRRVDVVAGPAGCGKTAGLATAHQLWVNAGYRVQGATVSWLAARELKDATGIPTASLAATMRFADRHGLTHGVVLVVDEASLVDTRTLTRLLRHVHAADGKLVLVGDPHQLPEIGAGGMFAHLAGRDTAITLTSNHRQHQPWERDALRALRNGELHTALDAYLDHDRIHPAATTPAALDQVAVDYQAARDRGETVLVLAARRADVAKLNNHIRDHLNDTGVLGAAELTVPTPNGERHYRVGEQVLVTVNDRARGLVNGTAGTLTNVNTRTGSVDMQCSEGRHVVLDRDWLTTGHLDHGYAVTVHKAQGLTVDTTLIYGTGPLTQEHAYVALSRGRIANHLYIAADTADEIECGHPAPDLQPSSDRNLTGELLDRLATRNSQQLASTYLGDQAWMTRDQNDEQVTPFRHHDYDNDRGYGLGR